MASSLWPFADGERAQSWYKTSGGRGIMEVWLALKTNSIDANLYQSLRCNSRLTSDHRLNALWGLMMFAPSHTWCRGVAGWDSQRWCADSRYVTHREQWHLRQTIYLNHYYNNAGDVLTIFWLAHIHSVIIYMSYIQINQILGKNIACLLSC